MENRSLIRRLFIYLGIACMGILVALNSVKAQTIKFQDLLKAAKKEAGQGTNFLLYSLTPRAETARNVLLGTFKKQYGLPDFKVDWLSLHQNVSIPRALTEIKAGRSGPDIIEPSVAWAFDIDRAGVLEPFDWVGTFGKEFSGIEEAAVQRAPKGLEGKWIRLYDATRAFAYNTTLIKTEDLPSDIEELTQPKWSRRFAMGATSPFDLLVLEWGEQRTIDIFKRLVANKPIMVRGTPAANNAVASGEAVVAFGSIHDVERLKKKGAPVEWKTYGNLLPVLGLGITVTTKAKHPNLARLFTAWFVTEGAANLEKIDSISRVTRKGSRLVEVIRQRVPNVKIVEPRSQEELKIHQDVRATLDKILGGGR